MELRHSHHSEPYDSCSKEARCERAAAGSRPPAMTTTVREALRLIAADPARGRKTFSDAAAMDGLLGDYLPDAPAEAAIIRAAVSAGVPGMLTTDLPPATSMPLAAARMF